MSILFFARYFRNNETLWCKRGCGCNFLIHHVAAANFPIHHVAAVSRCYVVKRKGPPLLRGGKKCTDLVLPLLFYKRRATYMGFCVQLSSPHREPRLSVLPWGGRPRAPACICRGGIIIRVRGCAARFCKDGEIQRFSVFP